MSADFYRAFEDKFRGSRELILSRLDVYLPFVRPIKEVSGQPNALDLGCGRGEWLELLGREGFDATGVDLDEGMLKACEQLHLNAHKADAIGYLESLPDASVGVISAFHMVEHIPFEALQQLVQQALRVLVPGGLLIMETPNPENLQVGAHTFYHDPTHQRPIPPMLLAFLPEHCGFARTKILRLQQDPRLDTAHSPNLEDVLGGPSPDYAVVAQKRAKAHILTQFDQAFATDHGLTLHTLATRYDASRVQQIDASRSLAQRALSSAEAASSVAQQALSSAEAASSVAQQAFADARLTRELITTFEATLQHYQHLTAATEQRMNDLLNSTSWRITGPFRQVSKKIRWLTTGLIAWATLKPGSRPRRTARQFLLKLRNWIANQPKLKATILTIITSFPYLGNKLLAIHRRYPHTAQNHTQQKNAPSPSPENNISTYKETLSASRKRSADEILIKIYAELNDQRRTSK